MDILFTIIGGISFILLIIGFFSPDASLFWYKGPHTRKNSAKIYLIGWFGSALMMAIVTPKQETSSSTANVSQYSSSVQNSNYDQVAYEPPQSSVPSPAARKANTISAFQLVNQYVLNEVNADENLKGKSFYVEGTIQDIAKDIMDDIYITLKGSNDEFEFRAVQCYINDANRVRNLRRGQRVTVYGRCDGLMMNVLMKNCRLVD